MTSAAELFRNRAKARVGTTVRDKWRLDALLGIGGTAAVYSATHRNGKRVAVKILRSELTSYEEVTTRFAREGYVANKIEHPGVVSVLDDDITEDGAPFLVMELLEGHSFDRYTKGPATALPVDRVMAMTDRVLDALIVAHSHNIVHRDLKPANIFLNRGNDVRVLDFGIARITDTLGDAGMTQTGTAIGTPGYMAPEQARGRWNEVDSRTDLWAVGATMYALLIGRRPRRADTVQEELLAAMTQPMAPFADAYLADATEPPRRPLPPGLAEFIDKAVAFDRNERFNSAAEMQAALRALQVAQYVPSSAMMQAAPREQPRGSLPNLAPYEPPVTELVDEATVASAPSWQMPNDDLSGATAYPFTLPSNPIAQPVSEPAKPSHRGVWMVAGAIGLSLVLAVVLFASRKGGVNEGSSSAGLTLLEDAGPPPATSTAVATPPPESPVYPTPALPSIEPSAVVPVASTTPSARPLPSARPNPGSKPPTGKITPPVPKTNTRPECSGPIASRPPSCDRQ